MEEFKEFKNLKLSKQEWEWFTQRMTETPKGAVTAPTYVLDKLRKIAGDKTIPRWLVKAYLIDECYNKYSYWEHCNDR